MSSGVENPGPHRKLFWVRLDGRPTEVHPLHGEVQKAHIYCCTWSNSAGEAEKKAIAITSLFAFEILSHSEGLPAESIDPPEGHEAGQEKAFNEANRFGFGTYCHPAVPRKEPGNEWCPIWWFVVDVQPTRLHPRFWEIGRLQLFVSVWSGDEARARERVLALMGLFDFDVLMCSEGVPDPVRPIYGMDEGFEAAKLQACKWGIGLFGYAEFSGIGHADARPYPYLHPAQDRRRGAAEGPPGSKL